MPNQDRTAWFSICRIVLWHKASGYSDLWLLMNLKEHVGESRMPEHYFAWAEQQLEEYLGKPVD